VIGYEQVERLLGEDLSCRVTIGSARHIEARTECPIEEREQIGLVIYDQNPWFDGCFQRILLSFSLDTLLVNERQPFHRGGNPLYWRLFSGKPSLSRPVLAISQDLEQLRRIVSNLERAGAEVETVRSPEAVGLDVFPHRYVFLGLSGGDDELLARTLSKLRNGAFVVVVAARATLDSITRYLNDQRVGHVIIGDELERGVFVTAQKLLTGDLFGIEKYLPDGTDVHYVRLRKFQDREKAVDSVIQFAASVRMRRQVRDAIAAVCEELLMNALYDAPVDDAGNKLFEKLQPRLRTKGPSPKPVSLRYAATPTQFAIAVRDRFGTLTKDTLLHYLDKCLSQSDQIDRKTYGAGLGLYVVANAAVGYVVNIAPGVATEVVCTFDRGAKTPLRLVSVFVHPGPRQGNGPSGPHTVEIEAPADE
jgi:hypothetical protein